MTIVTVEEAQNRLKDIIAAITPGEKLVITQDGEPVAELTRAPRKSWPCKAGSAKDKILWIAPDFDAPLEDFKDYME